jgi:hypothetical protein
LLVEGMSIRSVDASSQANAPYQCFFSKKLDNLKAAVALHFAWYNFVRVHKSLRVTPAMQAGVANHIWGIKNVSYLRFKSMKMQSLLVEIGNPLLRHHRLFHLTMIFPRV